MTPELEKALASASDDRCRADILNDEAKKLQDENVSLAMELALQARAYAESAGYKSGVAMSYFNTAILHKRMGNYEQALKEGNCGLALSRETNDQALQARLLNAVATFYLPLRNYTAALAHQKEAIAIQQELEDKQYLTLLLGNLGFIYHDFAEYDRALEACYSAIENDRNCSETNKGFLIAIYCCMSTCCQYVGDSEAELKYLQTATELAEEFGNSFQRSALYTIKGEYYQILQKPDQALEYWYKALAIQEKLGTELANQTLYQIGRALLAKEEYDAAQQAFEKAVTSSAGNLRANTLVCLGNVAFGRRQYNEARRYYEQALALATEIGEHRVLSNSHLQLVRIGEAIGDYYLAFVHQREAAEIYKKIFIEEKQKAIAEMQAKFDVETAEREKELLRGENAELTAALDEVRRLNDNLTKVNNEKNEVLGIVAHDLKSPLSGVRMVASLVKEHYRRMPEVELEHQLDAIIDSTERMLSISASLLNAQKIEKGDMYGAPQQVDVSAVVYQLADSYRQMAEQKNIGFETACEDSVNTVCSEEALRQAVENIVSNAVKFTPQGKKVTVRVRSQQKKVIVEVEDEGPGIRAQERKKLYGKYSRLSARPTGGESTTGLGLWIAKKAVEAMHGRIRCTSKVGSGTVFSIEVPLL